MEVHSLGKRDCRVRDIPGLYGVDVLIALKICSDAPTYSHPQCLGEKHGRIYLLTRPESCHSKLGMRMLVNFGVYWSCLLEIFVLDVHGNRSGRVRGGGKRVVLATATILAVKEFRLARLVATFVKH